MCEWGVVVTGWEWQWLSSEAREQSAGQAKGGQSGYKAGCGWPWMGMGMRGVRRVTLLARCEVPALLFARSLLARHGMVFTSPPQTSQRYLPTATRHHPRPCPRCQTCQTQSPADPVSCGTLPTAPAPTPRSCKRLRFFHGRTAAQRQMGKWAALGSELACAAIPACATAALLARALCAVASPAGEDHTGSTLSWCRSLAHACVAALATCFAGAVSTHRRWGERGQGGGKAGLQGSS